MRIAAYILLVALVAMFSPGCPQDETGSNANASDTMAGIDQNGDGGNDIVDEDADLPTDAAADVADDTSVGDQADPGDTAVLDSAVLDTVPEDTGPTDTAAVDDGPSDFGMGSTCQSYLSPSARGALPDIIIEASGLIVSRQYEGIGWLHNDSGSPPDLFAVNLETGSLLATVRFESVWADDWEDMAAGPCGPSDSRTCLYVGDIGDNSASRDDIRVHRLVEPDPSAGDQELPVETMNVSYPSGARDAEALVVDEVGAIYILSKKGSANFDLYSAPFEAGTNVTLSHLGNYRLSTAEGAASTLVTAADYDPSQRRLLIRSYITALEYSLGPEESLADFPLWLAGDSDTGQPRFVEVPAASEVQGEAIAYGEHGYWHVSEGENATIWFVGCAP